MKNSPADNAEVDHVVAGETFVFPATLNVRIPWLRSKGILFWAVLNLQVLGTYGRLFCVSETAHSFLYGA